MKKRKSPQQDAHELAALYKSKKEFDAEFPTDADCVDLMYAIGSAGRELTCRKKCTNRAWRRIDARIVQCSSCNQKVSLTAGTFFDGCIFAPNLAGVSQRIWPPIRMNLAGISHLIWPGIRMNLAALNQCSA